MSDGMLGVVILAGLFGVLIIFVVIQRKRIGGGLQEFADRAGLSFRQVNRIERRVWGTRDGREVEFFTSVDRKTKILCEHWAVEIRGCPPTLSCFQKSTIPRFDEAGPQRLLLGDPDFDDHVAAIDETDPESSRDWLRAHGGEVRALLESSDYHWIEEGALHFDKHNLDTKPEKLLGRLEELETMASRLE